MSRWFLGAMLLPAMAFAQSSVRGNLILTDAHDARRIAENTKVVLLTKTTRDTVSLSGLSFDFADAPSGPAYLYLVSTDLQGTTSYKFRVRKNKPTTVNLKYAKFENVVRREKSPEERQDDLAKGLLIARIAIDVFMLVKHFR